MTAAQLAQRLLQQFTLCHCDPAAIGARRDSHRHQMPTQRLLACAPVIAAGLHKCRHSGHFALVAVQQAPIRPCPLSGTLTQVQRHRRRMPCRRRCTDMRKVGLDQIVIGKEVVQELVKRADGDLRHTHLDVEAAAIDLGC